LSPRSGDKPFRGQGVSDSVVERCDGHRHFARDLGDLLSAVP